MNKYLLFFLTLVLSQQVTAQEGSQASELSREIGVRFTGFDDFNVIYKKEKQPSKYLRHRVAVLNGNFRNISGERTIDLAYAFGLETRKPISNGVSFYTGPDFLINCRYQSVENRTNSERQNNLTIIPAFGWILGFMIQPADRVVIGLELIPSATLIYNTTNYSEDTYSIGVGLNTNATALSVVYRF